MKVDYLGAIYISGMYISTHVAFYYGGKGGGQMHPSPKKTQMAHLINWSYDI